VRERERERERERVRERERERAALCVEEDRGEEGFESLFRREKKSKKKRENKYNM